MVSWVKGTSNTVGLKIVCERLYIEILNHGKYGLSLMGSLLAHENRISCSMNKSEKNYLGGEGADFISMEVDVVNLHDYVKEYWWRDVLHWLGVGDNIHQHFLKEKIM